MLSRRSLQCRSRESSVVFFSRRGEPNMVDRISRDHRSWNMSRIRSTDTKPEISVRSLLHRLDFRFQLHVRKLPGRPDIVLSKYRTVVFVHGCFWHRHEGCKYAYTPKTRRAFWLKKFRNNIRRHIQVSAELEELGWQVVVVWECEVGDLRKLSKRLKRTLDRRLVS